METPSAETPPDAAPPQPGASNRPPCARCGEPIRGAGLKALNAAWHKDCFVCTHCGQPFAGKILQKEGKPYCEEDFRALFGGSQSKTCRACEERITGPLYVPVWVGGLFFDADPSQHEGTGRLLARRALCMPHVWRVCERGLLREGSVAVLQGLLHRMNMQRFLVSISSSRTFSRPLRQAPGLCPQ